LTDDQSSDAKRLTPPPRPTWNGTPPAEDGSAADQTIGPRRAPGAIGRLNSHFIAATLTADPEVLAQLDADWVVNLRQVGSQAAAPQQPR
jgi:hypothetical protein